MPIYMIPCFTGEHDVNRERWSDKGFLSCSPNRLGRILFAENARVLHRGRLKLNEYLAV